MFDALYLVGTLCFFGLMLAYVAGCARLGRAAELDREADHEPR